LEANLRIGSTTQMIKPFPSLAYTQQWKAPPDLVFSTAEVNPSIGFF
jgi:hypothetical protein